MKTVLLVRWPKEESTKQFQVTRTTNTLHPMVGDFLDKEDVMNLLSSIPNIEVKIEICGIKK